MENPILKAGIMLTFKGDIENFISSVKSVEKELDENLQQSLMKTSSLIKIDKNMEEIKLMSEAIMGFIEKKDITGTGRLLTALGRKIYETRDLLAKDIQKSLLKAAEALTEAEGGLLLMGNLNGMVKLFDDMAEDMRGNARC
ncbi:hypothetical protein [Thermoanaerobacterium sp. DL9XJH110]|uniref:hypothetical protein n=1 Tax=Thermoanaerobacterium sp. DL9XJH110 TaxID=3386643 RepID=UPI003BB63ECF